MSQRNLEAVFRPASVALIGASERPGSVGAVVLANLIAAGFAGDIHPVNPKYDSVLGRRCWRRIADLPASPDLAIVMTPPAAVATAIGDLAARGCRGAVVITAGLTPVHKQDMLAAARPVALRIVGPNTIGLIAPGIGLNASFAHLTPMAGGLALVSQSGAVASSLIDWAVDEGIGFSHIVSLGEAIDVDVGDVLNWLADDEHTTAILLYLEGITEGRKFMSAARAAARLKPVLAIKAGRHERAAQAALTHTGALSGADLVVDAALRRAGIIRVDDLEDLFASAEICGRFRPLSSGRVAIVTNGGGAGVMAVDQLLDRGCDIATLAPDTIRRLDAGLPATWSRGNPVDIIGDAPPERYRVALAAVADDPGVDAILVMNCPTAIADPAEAARAVAAQVTDGCLGGKPVLASWLGQRTARKGRAILEKAGVATFDTPVQAAKAVALLTRWSALRTTLEQVPLTTEIPSADSDGIRALLASVAGEGRTVLTEPEAQRLVAAYGITVPETLVAAGEAEVADMAALLLARHRAVAVKIVSRQVTHKSDVGGVAVDIRSAVAAAAAARAMRQRLMQIAGATLDGFTVEAMVDGSAGEELLVGIAHDPVFGATITVGAGGIDVELERDVVTGLVPVDDVLAADMLDRTRVAKRLLGYRGRPAADRTAILRAVVAVSQMAVDYPAIRALDLNPLIAGPAGVIAVDARIEIDPARVGEPGPGRDLAIRPYPEGWTRVVATAGDEVLIRPLRPGDVTLYPDFLAGVEAEDMRLRFLSRARTLSRELLVRLTQLDYDRDIALGAFDASGRQLLGVARFAADADRERAEFAVLVRSDRQGLGLGRALMDQLIAYGRAHGLRHLVGIVLRENRKMVAFCRALGFAFEAEPDDPTLVRAILVLQDPARPDGTAEPARG
jgi:acetyltransferase